MDVGEAARSGDRRTALEALRDRLADEVERLADDGFCPSCKRGSSSVAPVAAQLANVLAQLDALPQSQEGTALDELTRRRARRPQAAQGEAGPAGR